MAHLERHTHALEMAHVLYLDFGVASLPPVDQKPPVEQDLERVLADISEIAQACKREQLILLPAPDGMALLFFGDLEAPVRCAVELSRVLRRKFPHIHLRMGAHTGPAYRETDLGANQGLCGGGVNVARGLTERGDDGHILVSATTADFLAELHGWKSMLHLLGETEVEGKRVRVFNLYSQEFGNPGTPDKMKGKGNTGSETALPASARAAGTVETMLGLQVSHYRILKRLGSGGMGVVYEAQDLRLGRRVAIKFVPEEQSHNRSRMERFMQEARAASSLNHANICIVHDVGDFEGRFFIVMELLEGDTLHNLIKIKRRRMSPQEIMQYGIQIADALECAHSQGIIHRDIKPANIFIIARGLKVLDFGLAKFTLRARQSEERASEELTETSSDLTGPGEFIGTLSYMSPEQARGMELDRRSDLFSFGVVLYEMSTGTRPFSGDPSAVFFEALLQREPVSPIRLNPELPAELERIIHKALEKDRNLRYQSAIEMRTDFERALARPETPTEPPKEIVVNSNMGEIAVLYKRNALPDEQILSWLEAGLQKEGYRVFVDRRLQVGMEWAREIELRVSNAYAVIVLLSGSAVGSEMLAYEVQVAHEAAQKYGKPRILPVRINYETPLPAALAAVLDGIQYASWSGPGDNEILITEITAALRSPQKPRSRPVKLETVGGAVPLDSKFYILRPTDDDFYEAIARRDSVILIKGARQMGKTSLMARGLQEARKAGAKVIMTDFQKLNTSHLESVEKLLLTLAEAIAEQLDLDVSPADVWNARRGPSMNFERFLRREVLAKLPCPLVWGLDEVDRLFSCNFGSEVFGLFRSWHNERSLDPSGPWQNLTLAIAYATEAHMFITDMNQSPFNVGTRLVLADFTLDQLRELNRRYDSPLKDGAELGRFHDLVAGQPYLTRRGLHELASRNLAFRDFERQAARDEGPFGDHLRRLLVSLAQDSILCEIMRGLLTGHHGATPEAFYRLRSSGLVAGESAKEMQPRCRLYELYLSRHLL
jgi:serine/threonine protein kinase